MLSKISPTMLNPGRLTVEVTIRVLLSKVTNSLKFVSPYIASPQAAGDKARATTVPNK
jgi:hypothetical protein